VPTNHIRGPQRGLAASGKQAGVAGSFAGHPHPTQVPWSPGPPLPATSPWGTLPTVSLAVSSSADTLGEPLWGVLPASALPRTAWTGGGLGEEAHTPGSARLLRKQVADDPEYPLPSQAAEDAGCKSSFHTAPAELGTWKQAGPASLQRQLGPLPFLGPHPLPTGPHVLATLTPATSHSGPGAARSSRTFCSRGNACPSATHSSGHQRLCRGPALNKAAQNPQLSTESPGAWHGEREERSRPLPTLAWRPASRGRGLPCPPLCAPP